MKNGICCQQILVKIFKRNYFSKVMAIENFKIETNGNDLEKVLAEIKSKNGFVSRMKAGKRNSDWTLEGWYREKELFENPII